MKNLLLTLLVIASSTYALADDSSKGKKVTIDGLKVKADLRLRHEVLDQQNQDIRNRQRIRARVGLYGDITEEVGFGFRMVSGGQGITSTNQTLDDGFAFKDLSFDQAFVTWQATESILLTGGKMSNPFFRPMKSQLVWDSDVTPEGAALKWNNTSGNLGLFFTTGAFVVEERSSDDNSTLYAAQLGVQLLNDKKSYAVFGLSAYLFTELKGQNVISDATKSFGNTVVDVDATAATQNQYVFQYRVYELFAEYKLKVADIPVLLAFDYIINGASNTEDNGYLIGFAVGSTKGKELPLQAGYIFREVEADSTLGVFTDSDAFNGGTDGRGHTFFAKYGLSKKTSLGTTIFLTETGISNNTNQKFYRAQFDIQFKY